MRIIQSLKIKQEEAPPVVEATDEAINLAQVTAISRFNLIVGHLPERGNAYNDLSQLPISLQKVWKTPQRITAFSLQSVQANVHRRTHKTARRDASAFREGIASSTAISGRLLYSHDGAHHWRRQAGNPFAAGFSWRAMRTADGKEAPQRQGQ